MKSGAKDLFFSFLGSKYQMMREGVIELYVSYNVSEKDEVIWIEELFLYTLAFSVTSMI